jgi:peroxiredoxin
MKTYIALLGVALAASASPAFAEVDWNYRIGEPAPAFTLTSLDGKPVTLADYRNKLVVISFMTSWCPFCNAAAPYFEQLNQKYQNKGVATFIVDVHEESAPISGFAKKHALTCPVLLDTDGKVTAQYAPPPTFAPDLKREETMIASFMIVDRQGRIQFLSLNEDTARFDAKLTRLQARLDQMLAGQ